MKQEEIRKGVRQILEHDADCSTEKSDWVADEIIRELHSQGVVIKVDSDVTASYGDSDTDRVQLVAVESLIKE